MIRRLRGSRKRRAAGLASITCSATLLLSGCFVAPYDTYVITPDFPGLLYTIKKQYSDALVSIWGGPTCNQDVSGDGTVGSRYDRALCTFFIIRTQSCNATSGAARNLCYAATRPVELSGESNWRDFNDAVDQVNGVDDCLAVHVRPGFDNTYNWTARRLNTGGCVP